MGLNYWLADPGERVKILTALIAEGNTAEADDVIDRHDVSNLRAFTKVALRMLADSRLALTALKDKS
jgi:hypothetical protein